MSKNRRSIDIIRDIKTGDRITAEYLQAVTRVLNSSTESMRGPRKYIPPGGAGAKPGLANLDFTETSRTQTATVFTDDNGDQTSINVIDEIVFVNPAGETLTLTFTN